MLARYIRNQRLYDAIDSWAFSALSDSPGARAFSTNDAPPKTAITKRYAPSGNRLVGILHGCLRHHTQYDENTAWAHRTTTAA